MKKEFENRTEWRNEKGQLHREDGPAIEWSDGAKEWYINGKRLREIVDQWKKINRKRIQRKNQ